MSDLIVIEAELYSPDASARLATRHFAPTPLAAKNLRCEGISPRSIVVTGNTGLDALLMASAR